MDYKNTSDPLFSEYVNNLPTDFSFFPVNFSDKDLEILKNTYVLKRINLVKSLLTMTHSQF